MSIHATSIVNTGFKQELFLRSPREIQQIILHSIGPCWYLIILGETRRLIEYLRAAYGDLCGRFSLDRDIYITQLEYQGAWYISRISNSPAAQSQLGVATYQRFLTPLSSICKIVLSVGHIGVRRIQLLGQDSDPLPDRSPWYEIHDVSNAPWEAHASGDIGLNFFNVHVA